MQTGEDLQGFRKIISRGSSACLVYLYIFEQSRQNQ